MDPDVDTTAKPLFGHQEGAVVGYNAMPSVVGDPPNAAQLRHWLTGDTHTVHMNEDAVRPLTARIETYVAPAP